MLSYRVSVSFETTAFKLNIVVADVVATNIILPEFYAKFRSIFTCIIQIQFGSFKMMQMKHFPITTAIFN